MAKTKLYDFWKKEDYWAIWLGTIILLTGLSWLALVLYMSSPSLHPWLKFNKQ